MSCAGLSVLKAGIRQCPSVEQWCHSSPQYMKWIFSQPLIHSVCGQAVVHLHSTVTVAYTNFRLQFKLLGFWPSSVKIFLGKLSHLYIDVLPTLCNFVALVRDIQFCLSTEFVLSCHLNDQLFNIESLGKAIFFLFGT